MISPTSGPQSIAVTYINQATNQPEYVIGVNGSPSSQSVYGAPRQDAYVPFNGVVPAVLSQDIFVSTDISMYDGLVFEVKAIAGTTPAIKAYISLDGNLADFSATPIALTDLSSGALATGIAGATGATAVGNYIIAEAFKAKLIKLTYTCSVVGATGATIRGSIWKR